MSGKTALTVLVELALRQRQRVDTAEAKLKRRGIARGTVSDYDVRSVDFHNEMLQVYATCTADVAELTASAQELLTHQAPAVTPNYVLVRRADLDALFAALPAVAAPARPAPAEIPS